MIKKLLGIILFLLFININACGSSSSSVTITVTFSPENAATNVLVDAAITATFSSAITEPSAWLAALTVKKDGAGDTVCTSVSYASLVATCAHANLDANSSYTISLAGISGVTDATTTFTTGTAAAVPYILSVKDAADAAISATGTTGVFPTSFDIQFSQPMDDASVTTAGNVTLTCSLPSGNSLAQPTISVAKSTTEDNTYTVTVTDAYKYQLLACTLTVTANAASASIAAKGAPIASAATYQFTNGCALNDDFNADSQGCWMVYTGEGATLVTWPDILAKFFTFDTAQGALDSDDSSASAGDEPFVYKTATLSPSAVEIIVHFSGISGFDTQQAGDSSDSLGLNITAASGNSGINIIVTRFNDSGTFYRYCQIDYSNDSDGTNSRYRDLCPEGEYYLRLYMDGTTTQMQFSTDGITYTDLPLMEGSDAFPSFAQILSALGTDPQFGISADTNALPTNQASIESIITTGITASGQY